MPRFIQKRTGELSAWDTQKVTEAIKKAFDAVKESYLDDTMIGITDRVLLAFERKKIVPQEQLQDKIEKVLMDTGYARVAKEYILYREKRRMSRDINAGMLSVQDTIGQYVNREDWRINENANVNFSFQGLILHTAGTIQAKYVLNLYSDHVKDAHVNGFFHIHDLSLGLTAYCAGWSLRDLLLEGFNLKGACSSGPAKHFDTVLAQMVNFIGTLQNEWAGAQAFNNCDTLLAPFIRRDNLTYEEVLQSMQRFIYNMNTSSRWGGQCFDAETEILTKSGWKRYNELQVGDTQIVFNMEDGTLCEDITQRVHIEDYDGVMYHMKGNDLDSLVTPDHRVVRKNWDTNKWEFVYARDCASSQAEFNIPSLETFGDVFDLGLKIYEDKIMVTSMEEVTYKGIIFCPTTNTGTVIARRKGKVFISGNCPFSNLTLDVVCPEHFRDKPVIIGGVEQDSTYGDYQVEMDMFNKAFLEVFSQGDHNGRLFTFPIPTYNVTKDFPWDTEFGKDLASVTAKYGIPYFQNFVNSDLKPEDVTSMCCRLRLDKSEIIRRTGGIFGSGDLTGSIGVVTLNLPRMAYVAKGREEFFELVEYYMDVAKQSLEFKRKMLKKNLERNMYPWSKKYLKRGYDGHFSTIGLVGGHEACLNLLGEGKGIDSEEGKALMIDVLNFMKDLTVKFQEETGNLYNLEATPAEGAGYRLAKLDKKSCKGIIQAGNGTPYYTNSTQMAVDYSNNPFDVIQHQSDLQPLYTGGTVFHTFLGEAVADPETVKNFIMKVFSTTKLPYLSITPTFSICEDHGYINGEHFECPTCGSETEVYSRIVGYYRPVSIKKDSKTNRWNPGKVAEYKERKTFEIEEDFC